MTEERPTPETDAADGKPTWQADIVEVGWVQSDFARRLERERDAERALADRLAEELESLAWLLWGHERPSTTVALLRHRLQQALAAWKEARND